MIPLIQSSSPSAAAASQSLLPDKYYVVNNYFFLQKTNKHLLTEKFSSQKVLCEILIFVFGIVTIGCK